MTPIKSETESSDMLHHWLQDDQGHERRTLEKLEQEQY
jgi:hypothetical protein